MYFRTDLFDLNRQLDLLTLIAVEFNEQNFVCAVHLLAQ